MLRDAEARISMADRGRWMDHVFIERLWRSLKYECVYLVTDTRADALEQERLLLPRLGGGPLGHVLSDPARATVVLGA